METSTRRRFGPLALAERAAAFGSVALLLSAGFTFLFAAPGVTPVVDPPGLSAIADRGYEVRVSFLNESGAVASRVALESLDASLRFEPRVAEIPPGGRREITIRGTANGVGAQTLPVRVMASAGRLHRPRVMEMKLPLAVWPAERFGQFAILAVRPDWVALRATIELGSAAPKGLLCSASLPPREPADLIGAAPAVSFPEVSQIAGASSGANGIQWTMAAIDAFRTMDVYLFARQRRTGVPVQWSAVVSRLAWGCERK